jgi:hypothetical protein
MTKRAAKRLPFSVCDMEQPTYIETGTYLFRFVDHRAPHFWAAITNLLSKHELFLNTRKNFNDPFDSQPVIEDDLSNRALRDYIGEAIKNPFNPTRSTMSVAKILEMRASGKTVLKKRELEKIKHILHKNAQKILDDAGLLSFSLEIENPLLWGHYAASFSGVCIAFKRGPFPKSGFVMCAEVSYVDERPRLPLSLIQEVARRRTAGEKHDDITNKILHRAFLRKSKHWSYEQEARIFYPFGAGKNIAFDPRELAGFILGPNSSDDLFKGIKRAISDRSTPVTLDKAALSQTEFRVVVPHKYLRNRSRSPP